jgi:hypothetical protein
VFGRTERGGNTKKARRSSNEWASQHVGRDPHADHPSEWYRFLAELGIPPGRAVPHDHHVWPLNLELADLSSARQLASVGLPPPHPGRATWPPYQDVGEALWREGWAGLLAPSAARPDRRIACIFATSWPPEHCTPIRADEITEPPPPPQGMTT